METPEFGNVLRIVDTEITGSVIATTPDLIEVHWSDGNDSIERPPFLNLEYV